MLPTKAQLAQALDDPVYDVAPWDSTVRRGFRNKLEGWRAGSGGTSWRDHNRVHRWVGGAMLGGAFVNDPAFWLHHAFVNDPAFWLHHAFVDLQWESRQARHRGQRHLPAGAPRRGDPQYRRVAARGEKLPPWNALPRRWRT